PAWRATMREESLFHLAREKPPAERSAFLDAVCPGDESLRRRLEAILATHDRPGSLLAHPVVDLKASTTTSRTCSRSRLADMKPSPPIAGPWRSKSVWRPNFRRRTDLRSNWPAPDTTWGTCS